MSRVNLSYVEDGDTTSAALANALYTDIDAASDDIDQNNTRTEWVSRKHMTDNLVLYHVGNDSATPGPITLTTYTAIADESMTWILNQGDVLRMHASIEGGEHTVVDQANDDFFFSFYWTRNDGGGDVTEAVGPEHHNSFLSKPGGGGTEQQYNYQKHSFSYVYIHTSATPRTIKLVDVRCRVQDTDNTFDVDRGHFAVMHIRRG